MSDPSTGLPAGWSVAISKSKGLPYYTPPDGSPSVWEIPEGTDETVLKAYLAPLLQGRADTPDRVGCLHLLQKHSGSRRPVDANGNNVTRSQEDARNQLKAWMSEIGSDEAKFRDYAAQYSDCSSRRRGGDLGEFGRRQMQKPFEDAAFALQPGQFSDIVSTDSGEHIIYRYK